MRGKTQRLHIEQLIKRFLPSFNTSLQVQLGLLWKHNTETRQESVALKDFLLNLRYSIRPLTTNQQQDQVNDGNPPLLHLDLNK